MLIFGIRNAHWNWKGYVERALIGLGAIIQKKKNDPQGRALIRDKAILGTSGLN